MKISFLLGAGASVDAGVPDTYAMTDRLLEKFEHRQATHWVKAVNYAVAALIHHKGAHGTNPRRGINIEEIVTALRLLASRDNSDAAPFVDAWSGHIVAIEKEEDTQRRAEDLLKKIYQEFTERFPSYYNTSRELVELIQATASPEGGAVFEEAAGHMLLGLIDLSVIRQPRDVSYLGPLLEIVKSYGVEYIYSLNYDNAIELLTKDTPVTIDYCFNDLKLHAEGNEFEFKLIKLHGSINWVHKNSYIFWHRPQSDVIELVEFPTDVSSNWLRPALIFGTGEKLTVQGPFLDLLRCYENSLTEMDVVCVMGYSFRDEHINYYLWRWMRSSTNRRLIVLDLHTFEEVYKSSGFVQSITGARMKDQLLWIPGALKDTLGNLKATIQQL